MSQSRRTRSATILCLVSFLCGACNAEPTATTVPPPSGEPTSSPLPRPSRAVSNPARELLATLPERAGDVEFNGVQVIDDAFNAAHPVDDVLGALGKKRSAAVAVFRYSEASAVTIGATTVEGIDGVALLMAFADTWNAPAVIDRHTRILGGMVAWQLTDRLGRWTVVYRKGNAVYLVEALDQATLNDVLADMPSPIP